MMKCDVCGMMMKDDNEARMHNEMMRAMTMHMMKAMEMGMDMGMDKMAGQKTGMGQQGMSSGGMSQKKM